MSPENPIRSKDVAFRAVEDEMLLVSAGQGRVLSVNPLGARVWELSDGSRSAADIVQNVQTDFDVEPAMAERDVEAFLTDLANRGFLTWSKGEGTL